MLIFLRMALSGFVGLMACSVYAQTVTPDLSGNDAHWIRDEKSNCWAANPNPKPGESIVWVGACANSLATGEGTLIWYQDGKIVGRDEGTFRDGALIGRGRMQREEGISFEGAFPGTGILTLPSGQRILAESMRVPAGWAFQESKYGTGTAAR